MFLVFFNLKGYVGLVFGYDVELFFFEGKFFFKVLIRGIVYFLVFFDNNVFLIGMEGSWV